MTITLRDGTEMSVKGVHGKPIQFEGISRDSLIFMMDLQSVTIERVLEKFTSENCSVIKIVADNGDVAIHENYTIRVEIGKGYRNFVLSGTVDQNDLSEVVYVRMAQSTLAERTIQEHQEILDAMVVQSLN